MRHAGAAAAAQSVPRGAAPCPALGVRKLGFCFDIRQGVGSSALCLCRNCCLFALCAFWVSPARIIRALEQAGDVDSRKDSQRLGDRGARRGRGGYGISRGTATASCRRRLRRRSRGAGRPLRGDWLKRICRRSGQRRRIPPLRAASSAPSGWFHTRRRTGRTPAASAGGISPDPSHQSAETESGSQAARLSLLAVGGAVGATSQRRGKNPPAHVALPHMGCPYP